MQFCGLAATASVLLFLLVGMKGDLGFTLAFRAPKVIAMALVASAVAISTVIFQTITNNKILTPSIMGFDALYALLQTLFVFFFGIAGLVAIDPRVMFLLETGTMVLFSALLFQRLFSGMLNSLHLMLLAGIVFGSFFRSLSNFMQRLIDPNDLVVLQDRMFASFNTIRPDLLLIAFILIAACVLVVWRMLPVLDVLALGRETAINLGVDHRKSVFMLLILIAVMVSVSTTLSGPITFFGLLVANLAYQLAPSSAHRHILPVAVAVAVTVLLTGQVVLEHVLALDGAIGIVIELAGGLIFIFLLLRGSAR
ncbi:iron chelate uptake ABC transporter family permease subunit [Rhizobium sp. FKL33]|uniref:iron chelate uptake ABC transporter family permease subunit n=1 Tax=Rhizobium sp. FKL33 TaxID=2562307 RepID=UPI0010C0EA18|nr:iron chelate uptake ABC transporter family permease subunit [Rhizobium sp. FKL33]